MVPCDGEIAGRAAYAVARALGVEPVVFPGGHNGFLGGEYGQTGQAGGVRGDAAVGARGLSYQVSSISISLSSPSSTSTLRFTWSGTATVMRPPSRANSTELCLARESARSRSLRGGLLAGHRAGLVHLEEVHAANLASAHNPSIRPMISFWISVVPP